mmetsp:Transcript_30372/g.56948  ORF Transcript_30372/g.56948 Transcript_30372/m.56948 type:complete len:347 (+) Transcript_30372:39-1079(+)
MASMASVASSWHYWRFRRRLVRPKFILLPLTIYALLVQSGLKSNFLYVAVSEVATSRQGCKGALRPSGSRRLVARAAFSEETGDPDGTNEDPGDCQASQELRLAQERLTKSWNEGATSAGSFATSPSSVDWTVRRLALEDGIPPVGTVLLADPRRYFASDGGPALHRSGRIEMADGSRRERANLPVVLITQSFPDYAEGLFLGQWSGKLMGDLKFNVFMTRPLYFAGPNASETRLCMLHSYPDMPSSKQITSDGLAWSSDFREAERWIEEAGSSLRFKIFLNSSIWQGKEVSELSPKAGVWIPVRVSRDLLLREPDSSIEEPLWVQYAEKAGGDLAELAEEFGLFA